MRGFARWTSLTTKLALVLGFEYWVLGKGGGYLMPNFKLELQLIYAAYAEATEDDIGLEIAAVVCL
jgi:hypothetical protein